MHLLQTKLAAFPQHFLHFTRFATKFRVRSDEVVKLLAKEVAANPDHGHGYSADVTDAHEKEEDCLLEASRGGDVERHQTRHPVRGPKASSGFASTHG